MPTITSAAGKSYEYPDDRYSDSTRDDKRRNPNKGGFQIAQMWDRHHEIARRIVLGESNKDIAQLVGVTPEYVSTVRNSPVVQEKLAIMRAARDSATIDLAQEITNLAPIALKRVKEALEEGTVNGRECSAATILKEANGLLDREMGKAIQRVDSRHLHQTLGQSDIDRIKERARELAGSSGQMVVEIGDGANE